MTERFSRLRRLGDARAALLSFGVIAVGSIPLLLHWGRRWWFWADDWDFLAARTAGNAGDLFRGHYQHWTTVPVLVYRLWWFLFGLRSYVPYQLLVIVAHLIVAALLRVVMRRAGVNAWLATLTALVFVYFGSGAENILIAFQITFVGSLLFGLVQLLLADHDGPIDRRDWLGLLAGFAGLMCSGVAITMTIIVGLAMLLRRGWRIALLHTAPLAIAYVIWSLLSPGGTNAGLRSQSPLQVMKFMVIGVGSAFGRLGGLPGLGFVLALMMLVGLTWLYRVQGRGALRGRLAVPAALLAGAIVFLLVSGLVRSGQPGAFANSLGVGPERARQSRYVYLIVAMALPALALAADAVIRRRRWLAIPVVALLVAGVPGNIHRLATYANISFYDRQAFRAGVLEAPRLPLARELPRGLQPAPAAWFRGLTLGWLVDSLPSGRLPAPPHLTTAEIATQTLHLALQPVKFPLNVGCRTFSQPGIVVLDKLDRVTLKSGEARITYLPPTGGASRSEAFFPRTFASPLDSMRLRITPRDRTPIVVCVGHEEPIGAP